MAHEIYRVSSFQKERRSLCAYSLTTVRLKSSISVLS
jgi:hypothetical protein